ncbi:GyrI-like domain-containing protein [Sporolactobacillus laevolacticus]|uniref:Transcriptional regulator n=1 Tax=Sporolactobacillus laevolacticus DSM 442 TaxID=1395513 RepID=V6IWG3_9BACL|nr:GyrI-like domain-containing protein [Sporolactobacillus laevolacticus]EST10896.1 transcriptional regulator [Sporolactobacillus laevolacticus DSM 442]
MSEYTIQTKEAFTILAYGTRLPDDYAQIPAAKAEWWQTIINDGRWDQLRRLADNDLEFAINEAVNNEMWYYSGVQSSAELPDSDYSRAVQFPAGEYLVIAGSSDNAGQLFSQLEGAAFGEVLPNATDFAYVGGPNTSVKTSETDGKINGEIWIPIVRK